jgi:hypothetical protein
MVAVRRRQRRLFIGRRLAGLAAVVLAALLGLILTALSLHGAATVRQAIYAALCSWR